MTKEDLAQLIVKESYLKGRFQLRSGLVSNEYFDKYRFESQPRCLKEIALRLAKMIPKDSEVLAGLEMGGIPLVTALSMETGLPAAFIRKAPKTYGTCRLAEGASVKGKRVCLVEDIITTGGQVVDSAQRLRKQGAIITQVLCVIYRGEEASQKFLDAKLTYCTLFTMEELGVKKKSFENLLKKTSFSVKI